MGVWLAAVLFVVMVAGGVVAFGIFRKQSNEPAEDVPTEATAIPVAANDEDPSNEPSGSPPVAGTPVEPQPTAAPDGTAGPRSLDPITWTVATDSTLDQLATAWSFPRETLIAMNPTLPTGEPVAAGTHVIVHTGTITDSESVGPPNDGRLNGAVPFPEGRTWLLAPDRTRAFGTGETVVAVLAALDAYAALFPDAAPIQLGEISARKGGPIYGHQSHQAGRDIDIRLVVTEARDRFDPERNWALVKLLIESGEVVSIFLNRSQQVWLRAAAEADVGKDGADRYFALIKHEAGHTIHIHVRFRCPDSDYRCVAYSLDETDGEVTKKLTKLPSGGGGGALIKKKGKIPVLRPKTKPKAPSTKVPTKGR